MDAIFQYELFVFVAPLTALIVIGVISFAQLRFPSKETRSLTWLMLTISGWLVFNTLEVYVPTQGATLFNAKLTYIFISLTPVAWFAFALRYTGQEKRLKLRNIGLLLAIPVISILLVWTNDWHHLIWQQYRFIPVGKMLAIAIEKYGLGFWVAITYNYILTFGGSILLLTHFFRNDLYRSQSYWLVAGALTPLVANFTYVFRLIPDVTKDYTPISFGVGILAFAAAIVRHRLFDLLPVARETMIDSMSDAMFIIDTQNRVTDCNSAGTSLLDIPRNALIGQPAEEAFQSWSKLIEFLRKPVAENREITHVGKAGVVYFDIQFLPLNDRNQDHAGHLLVLRNITDLRRTEEVLERSNQELRASNRFLDAYAQTLARDLKNPLLSIRASATLLKTRQNELQIGTIDYLINNVTDNSQKVLTLIEELLMISSVRSAEASFTTLNMGSLAESALNRIQNTNAFQKEHVHLPENWPIVFGKPAWVEEIWVNYLTVFAQSNTQDIVLALGASKDHAKKNACFWVQNIGTPLSTEERIQLTRTFNELETIRMNEFGLGLSMVKRIVNRLGGEMGMDGDVHTRLWFSLPLQVEKPIKDGIISEKTIS